MRTCYLTTVDNPFKPSVNYESWNAFAIEKGYNSAQYLARIARTSNALTDKENEDEIERAIDEIIELNPGLYRKIIET